MYCYYNNGISMRMVDSDYVAQTGEILFSQIPNSDQLASSFSGYSAAATTIARQPFIASAQAALDKSDITVLRCYSAAVPVPEEWQAYRTALRAITGLTDTTSVVLPTMPAYPSGT